jgi:hypothetical protein
MKHIQFSSKPVAHSPTALLQRRSVRLIASVFLCLLVALAFVGSALVAGRYATAASLHKKHASTANELLTYKYDNNRSGTNPNETILNTGNVNSSQFGLRVTYPVDGQVYAQPLYMSGLNIDGGTHNVVFVATENDSVYAFDADEKGSPGSPLWHTSFINPSKGITTVSDSDVQCNVINPQYGITGTPVIDPNAGILYVVAATKDNGVFYQTLHALSILTGQEMPGSPVVVSGSVQGTGDGSVGGYVSFDAHQELQRPGLLLLNGVVYASFGSHCDENPYHGWVFGYNSSTLQQVAIYNATRNGSQGAIWQSGGGLSADSSGNIYFMTGNGTFDADTGGPDFGDAFVKLSTQNGLTVADYMAPFNQACMDYNDQDLGSGSPMLIPTDNELVGVGKEGRIYVINRSNMGKYTVVFNPCANQGNTHYDKIVQELQPGSIFGLWGTPTYVDSSAGQYIYFGGSESHLTAFSLNNGLLSTNYTSESPEKFGYGGCDSVTSSDGTIAGTAILWCIDPAGYLRAYDATNLGHELYNHSINGSVKFTAPGEANGRVFVGTQNSLQIFGLLNS